MGGLLAAKFLVPAAIGAGAAVAISATAGKPKAIKAPPVPVTPPIPKVGEEVGDIARKKRPRGRKETFLTGELIPAEQDLKKLRLG